MLSSDEGPVEIHREGKLLKTCVKDLALEALERIGADA
jgi:hypothetical protein